MAATRARWLPGSRFSALDCNRPRARASWRQYWAGHRAPDASAKQCVRVLNTGQTTVHRGQRTQHSTPNQGTRPRKQASMVRNPEADLPPPSPKSAARLSAESAFADPTAAATPPHPVQIIVRRARTTLSVGQPVATRGPSAEIAPPAKLARVFLVRPAPGQPLVEAAPSAVPLPAADSRATGSATPKGRPPSRSRHTDAAKQPGPLVQVIAARAEQAPQVASNSLRASDLIVALAPVTPVLELIALAQAFTLADARMDEKWLRLSRRLQACQAQLRSQLG